MNSADDTRPALLGGPPIRPQGPPDWPPPDEDVLRALQAAYADGSWGKYHGPTSRASKSGSPSITASVHALTCGSGTFAMELALRALKVGPGDEVILSAYDYPGNFLAVHAVGAMPVLVDLDAGELADVARPSARGGRPGHEGDHRLAPARRTGADGTADGVRRRARPAR